MFKQSQASSRRAKRWKIKSPWISVFLIFVVAGCPTRLEQRLDQYPEAQETYDNDLQIVKYYPAYGIGFEYMISRTQIIVLVRNGFGHKKREVEWVSLSEEQSKDIFASINAIPIAELQSQYINPNIIDGMELLFDFKIDGMPRKTVHLSNFRHPELTDLMRTVDSYVETRI